jgi:hypothetical protein
VLDEGGRQSSSSLALLCQSGKSIQASLSAKVPWTKTTSGRTMVSAATVTRSPFDGRTTTVTVRLASEPVAPPSKFRGAR